MQVSKAGIERLKGANPLADVVAERGIVLRKKGQGLFGLCPFHEEKTASFNVNAAKGLFHCFGCGVSGDVIGFVTRHDRTTFAGALEALARRAGLDLGRLMEERPRRVPGTPIEALTPPPVVRSNGKPAPPGAEGAPPRGAPPGAILSRVVEHYHRVFCEREDAQAYAIKRGLTDPDLLRALKVGYADGSLLKLVGKDGDARDELVALGVVTREGRELLGGCLVVPIPDPLSGAWVNLYGRGVKTPRHCYLPGPLRGILNFQAARLSEEVVLTESVIDAVSFHQAGIPLAIPLYGANGFTGEHLDLLKREGVKRVFLALDGDEAGRRASEALREKLAAAGIAARRVTFPEGVKDANELLVARDADAGEAFRQLLDGADPPSWPSAAPPAAPGQSEQPAAGAASRPAGEPSGPAVAGGVGAPGGGGEIAFARDGLSYRVKLLPSHPGRLLATVKALRGESFHADRLDLYASRSRTEFARRAGKALSAEASSVEADLLALLVQAEKALEEGRGAGAEPAVPAAPSGAEREEALGLLRRRDLLDQVARDIDALGYVGEDTNKRLLYLVAISRKLSDPLSAIVLSQSGAGKSGLTEVIERLTPPEDVVLLTRLTPQSLYYVEPGFLDQKLVIVEERYGSLEADYSIRVLQSRKKLIAAAPVKDPSTGNMRTKVFMVEARAAFIEATTAASVNHENATRCFELQMDESEEQTRRIHERQRILRTAEGLRLRREAEAVTRRHWNAQRLLEPLPVVIPYADRLSFPTAWMRTRRDHARFLNLIEVSAFLHQHQRERTADGAVLASLADYRSAWSLAGEVLRETLTDVRRPLREAYARIQALSANGRGGVSRREVREALNVPDSTVRGWLQELVDLEYLEAEGSRGGAGKTTRYRLTERGPRGDLTTGLLSPEDLASVLDKGEKTRERAENPRGPLAGSIS